MDDNYPNEGRRRFVKNVVGAGVLATFAAGGVATVDWLTQTSGVGGGSITYMSNVLLAGPAPRGMPIIPLKINSSGEIIGRAPSPEGNSGGEDPSIEVGGQKYTMSWFQYCGVQQYAGVQPAFESDNKFKYDGTADWHSDMKGEVMKVSDFDDWKSYQGIDAATEGLGKPAYGSWRSEGADNPLKIGVIKTDKQRLLDNAESSAAESFIEAACPQGFVGWLNKCTHFCCVPQGFQTTDYGCGGGDVCSADMIYCQCHQSRYDPFKIIENNMTALPRPYADEVLGGGGGE